MLVLIWVTVVIVSLVLYLRDVHSKLSQRELSHLPAHAGAVHMTLLPKTQNFKWRIIGHYEFLNPIFLVKDPELLKNIAVKDFEYFVDRRLFGGDSDPVFSRNLLLLKGEEWKSMRATLSPAFTSSKIKLMVPFIVEVGETMLGDVKTKIGNSQGGYIDVDIKNLTTRFANDVIATCAFGLKVNSTVTDNEFYKNARAVTNIDFRRVLKFIGFRSFPWLMKQFKTRLIDTSIADFFSTVVMGTMKQRERHNIIRHDMIHLLMEAKKGQLSHDTHTADAAAGFATVEESAVGKKNAKTDWSDTDLVAQAVLFLLAGFETVSTTMSFLLHELAANPDIQDRLVKEIKENEAENGGNYDYESIQKMVYLDMIVSETLRMWPAAPMIDRKCVKTYNAGKVNKTATKDFVVKQGETLTVSVWAFHRNPQYFPNPDKFDPERFSEKNRHTIMPFTYMPFGVGPRNCIGSRFALCEVKVMICQFLKNLEVSLCEKSCAPAQLQPGFAMRMKGGHWLRIKIRKQ